MFPVTGPTQLSVRKLIVLTVLFHVFLYMSVTDIYFPTPFEKGLKQHKSEASAVAKRVVVFVSDGLRFEEIFSPENEHRVPFLARVKSSGSFGTCHAQVPKQSRPAHVALFAGMYEDPSNPTEGWRNNPIEFDHVFNQSANSWLWGNADMVTMFNRGELPKIRIYHYQQLIEEYREHQSDIDIDHWVFDQVRKFFKAKFFIPCSDLCEDKNILLIHFVGVDKIKDINNHDRRGGLVKLEHVDFRLDTLTSMINRFFKDGQTTYIFTSGQGSVRKIETETPFIIWGAGVKHHKAEERIMQADIAPLISTILGINIPIHSVGVLPDHLLVMGTELRARALFANALQLGEQFLAISQKVEKSSLPGLYQPYGELTTEYYDNLVKLIEYHLQTDNFNEAIEDIRDLIDLIEGGLIYFNYYYKFPLLICVTLSLVLWIVYLGICVPNNYTEDTDRVFTRYLPMVSTVQIVETMSAIVAFIGVMWLVFFWGNVALKYYIYFTVPLVLLIFLTFEINQFVYCYILLRRYGFQKSFFKAILYLSGIEILVLTFFYRTAIVLVFIGCIFWALTQVKASPYDKFMWMLFCFCTGLTPQLPYLPLEVNFTLTLILMSIYGYNTTIKLSNEMNEFRTINGPYRLLYIFANVLQFNLLIVAGVVVLTVGVLYEVDIRIPDYVYTLSWGILVSSFTLMHVSPTLIVARLFTILNALFTVYSLMSFAYESLFLFIFIYFMHEWAHIEFCKSNISTNNLGAERFSEETATKRSCNDEDFRKAFFFVTFILVGYFGSGNIPSIIYFDPMWIRCFISIFNPYTVAFLSVLKISIPFLIALIFFRLIGQFTFGRLINVFTIAIIFCEIIIMNLMLLIQNEGPWLEITLSISRFATVNGITIILVVFYALVYFMTCSPFYDFLYQNILHIPRPSATQATA